LSNQPEEGGSNAAREVLQEAAVLVEVIPAVLEPLLRQVHARDVEAALEQRVQPQHLQVEVVVGRPPLRKRRLLREAVEPLLPFYLGSDRTPNALTDPAPVHLIVGKHRTRASAAAPQAPSAGSPLNAFRSRLEDPRDAR